MYFLEFAKCVCVTSGRGGGVGEREGGQNHPLPVPLGPLASATFINFTGQALFELIDSETDTNE